MAVHEEVRSLSPDQLDSVSGGTVTLGVYRPGFQYKKESLQFFKECVGDDVYARAMNSEAGTPLPLTSPMQKNSFPSRKWKSNRSPPTSLAGVSEA